MSAGKKPKKTRPGKRTYFPRVERMTITYPASETGGMVEIIKGRNANHHVLAEEDVLIRETVRRKPEKS